MDLYKRPLPPDKFEKDAQPHRDAVADLIKKLKKKPLKSAAQPKPAAKANKKAQKKNSKAKKDTIPFKDVWGNYKDHFAYAQFDKCGFCESDVKAAGHGDVEHYYPKGEVWELTVKGRRRSKRVLSERGYWWKAYDWSNYLFACQKCNGSFKGSYFPVKETPRRLPPDHRPSKRFPTETPLLLNPYENIDPTKHLKFANQGLVLSLNASPFGEETIRTCGLNRPELIQARDAIYIRANELMSELSEATTKKETLSALKKSYALGRDDRPHSGMVRAIFKEFGVLWEDLVKKCASDFIAQLKAAKVTEAAQLEDFIEAMGRQRYKHSEFVRKEYEATTGKSWDDLAGRCAGRLVKDILAAEKNQAIQAAELNFMYDKLYDMARESPDYEATVIKAFESSTGMKWADLERKVQKRPALR